MSDEEQVRLNLLPGESVVATGACNIFAAYVQRGMVGSHNEEELMTKAAQIATKIALQVDAMISEGEEIIKERSNHLVVFSSYKVLFPGMATCNSCWASLIPSLFCS